MGRRPTCAFSFALFLLAGLLIPIPGFAARTTLRGVVFGAAQAPLTGVRVTADEIGISRDTDAKGRFSLTVPLEVETKGLIRISFSLTDHQTQSLEIKLPRSGPLEVTLTPLYARTFQPTLPPALAGRLRVYRKEEIRRVHDFLGPREKKLLSIEGLAGVGSVDLVLIALQDAPKAARRPILWWDCEETDSLTLLAEEWARAFLDPNLGNLVRQRDEVDQERSRRELDRETLARLLTRFERTPHTIVLNRFDRWLSAEKQDIQEVSLADLVSRFVAHPQAGKLVLLSEVKPALPQDFPIAWADSLVVKGLAPSGALDFLRNHLEIKADPVLLQEAAARLGGHPFALQLLAGSLADLEVEKQNNRLRQFLQVGESIFGGNSLGPLLDTARRRLAPLESQILDLLTLLRQPLTAGEMQEIGVGREKMKTTEEIRRGAERLTREHYWLESFQDMRTGEARYRIAEVTRSFLEERIGEDRAWKAEIHRRSFASYRKRYIAALKPKELPSIDEMAAHDELVRQAFSLAEIVDGEERQVAILVGGQVARDGWTWQMLRGSHRLLLSQLKNAQKLLEGQPGEKLQSLYADVLVSLGDLFLWMDRLADAEEQYEKALPIHRAIGTREGEAHSLRSLGDLYVRKDRISEAEERYQDALTLYRVVGGQEGEAQTLRSLGDLYARKDQFAGAERYYEEALLLYRSIEIRLGEANTLMLLGSLYVRTDRVAEAEKCYQDALTLYRALGSRLGEANIFRFLGDLHRRTNRIDEARNEYGLAVALYRAIESRLGEANTLKSLGDMSLRKRQHAEAEKLFHEAVVLYREIGSRLGEANTLRSMGDLYLWTSRLTEAERYYEQALPLHRDIGSRIGEASTLRSLGDVYLQMNRSSEAEERYREALPLFRAIESRQGEANVLLSLGDLYAKGGRLAEAEKYYEQSLALNRVTGSRLGEANALKQIGVLHTAQERFRESEKNILAALSIFETIDGEIGEINCFLVLSDLYWVEGRDAEAVREALNGLLLLAAIDLSDHEFRNRFSGLSRKLGPEAFSLLVKKVLVVFSAAEQTLLIKMIEGMGFPLEKPDPTPAR